LSSEQPPRWRHAALRDRLTAERLGSYVAAADGDLVAAFALYEWNMRASAGVLTTTGIVEVIVRNAMDQQLRGWATARRRASTWLDLAPLDEQGRRDIAKARQRATRQGYEPEVHGKVIAELNFGFWRYLAASRYLTSLWVPALHQAFPRGPRDLRTRRKEVERRLQQLMFVRNRAAHHEPIHRRDLMRDHDWAVELLSWIDDDCAAWLEAQSPIPDLSDRQPQRPALPSDDHASREVGRKLPLSEKARREGG
jgi:hypothetical protein